MDPDLRNAKLQFGGKLDGVLSAEFFHTTNEQFIKDHLDRLTELERSCFIRRKLYHHGLIRFDCYRHNHPTGQSSGDPEKTRANACPGRIVYKFVELNGRNIAIIAVVEHRNHDLSNSAQLKVARIDPETERYALSLMNSGLRISRVMVIIDKRARMLGYTDPQDRRFFLVPLDLKVLKDQLKNYRNKLPDPLSVDLLMNRFMSEFVLLYQSFAPDRPLLAVLQSEWQRQQLLMFGTMLFIDATYSCVTIYGFAFYVVMVRNALGRGIPVAFIIMSTDDVEQLTRCLLVLKEKTECSPKFVMSDKDKRIKKAVAQVWPSALLLLCWFHVLRAIQRWMKNDTKSDMRTKGLEDAEKRHKVVSCVRLLKASSSEMEFVRKLSSLEEQLQTISAPVLKYLRDNWWACAKNWANFGRHRGSRVADTNNVAERFFQAVKNQFLQSTPNQRLDNFVVLICTDVLYYYEVRTRYEECGRIKVVSAEERVEKKGLRYYNKRKSQMKFVDEDLEYIVLSESVRSDSELPEYTVSLVFLTCSCPVGLQCKICKHIEACRLYAANVSVYPEDDQRRKMAEIIHEQKNYHMEEDYIIINDEEREFCSVVEGDCTCFVATFKLHCVCRYLVERITTPSLEITVPAEQDLVVVEVGEGAEDLQMADVNMRGIVVTQVLPIDVHAISNVEPRSSSVVRIPSSRFSERRAKFETMVTALQSNYRLDLIGEKFDKFFEEIGPTLIGSNCILEPPQSQCPPEANQTYVRTRYPRTTKKERAKLRRAKRI